MYESTVQDLYPMWFAVVVHLVVDRQLHLAGLGQVALVVVVLHTSGALGGGSRSKTRGSNCAWLPVLQWRVGVGLTVR